MKGKIEHQTFQNFMGMNDKGGYSTVMSIPVVNIIISIVMTIEFPICFIWYITSR